MSRPRLNLRPWFPALRRAWWALLVLVHLPALAAVGGALVLEPASVDPLTVGALGATVLLFVLKLLDVPCLRFRSRRAMAAFVLVCCLVHHEAMVAEAGRQALQQTPAALATGVVVEGLRRARPGLVALRDRLVRAPALPSATPCGVVVPEVGPRLAWLCAAAPCGPRAPPV